MAPDGLIVGGGRGTERYFEPMRKPSVRLKPAFLVAMDGSR
jgi:hypothetical protein